MYEYYAQLPPDTEYMQQKYNEFSAGFTPAVFSAPSDIGDQLDQLSQENRRIILSMNHTHASDQFPVAAAINTGEFGKDMATRPISIFAKDTYFQADETRDAFDRMNAIPIFQRKNYEETYGLVVLGRAAIAAIQTAVIRMKHGQNLSAFWEGERNTSGNVRRIQKLQSGLSRVVRGLGSEGVEWAVVNVAIAHDNLDTPRRTVIHVNEPLLELPNKPVEMTTVVTDDLQQAVDHAYALLDRVILNRERTKN